MQVIKKDNTKTIFDENKIIKAINKSANRVMVVLTDKEKDSVLKQVQKYINSLNTDCIEVSQLHNIVELALEKTNKLVAKSYREYRNYKTDFVGMLDEVYQKAQSIMYLGDKENSNTDSALVSTKRSLVYNELNKELYNKFFLTTEEKQACRDGYIYINDKSARRDTINCCLFDVETVMKNGFEMGNIWYNEPKTIDTACDVLGDIIMMSASQQYGGLTVPEVDKLLAPYVQKSINKYYEDIVNDINICSVNPSVNTEEVLKCAIQKARRDLEQGVQGLEYKLNSVASSRGDYPFVTFTFGENVQDKNSLMISEVLLETRKNGQGKKGLKKCVLFPKLVFLYVEDYHGENKPYEWLFNKAIDCSSIAMYPDYLSLTGEGYIASMYKKYKKIISPMGQQLVA